MNGKFYADQLTQFVGGKIITVVLDTDEEFFGLMIETKGGKRKVLWFLQDDEGNGPGSFDIE